MIKILILICAAATPRADCERSTAVDSFYVQDDGQPVTSDLACMMVGQQFAATTALRVDLGKEYVKVRCERPTSIGKDHTA